MNSLCSSGRCTGRFQEKRSGLTYVQRLKSTDRSLLDTSEITFFQFESYKTLLIQSIMAESGTKTVTLTDAPLMPEVLRMTLREKSMWERFKETCQGLSPEKLMAAFDTEKQRIMKNVKDRGHITEEEAELLNKMTEENIKKTLEEFKAKVLKEMEITTNDTPEQIEFKVSFADKLVQWLEDLLAWVVKKIKEIFSTMEEDIDRAWEKAKEFFDYLWSLF